MSCRTGTACNPVTHELFPATQLRFVALAGHLLANSVRRFKRPRSQLVETRPTWALNESAKRFLRFHQVHVYTFEVAGVIFQFFRGPLARNVEWSTPEIATCRSFRHLSKRGPPCGISAMWGLHPQQTSTLTNSPPLVADRPL